MLCIYTRQIYPLVYNNKAEVSIFHNIDANAANDRCLTIPDWLSPCRQALYAALQKFKAKWVMCDTEYHLTPSNLFMYADAIQGRSAP
jgi:hypothetical protein